MLCGIPVLLALTLTAQAQNAPLTGYQTKADATLQRRQLANLQQDVTGLRELVEKLLFELQDLQRENKVLKEQVAHLQRTQVNAAAARSGISPEDMDKVISAMRAQIYKDLDKVRSDFYKSQDEMLVKMNKALNEVSSRPAAAPPPPPPTTSSSSVSTPAASPAAAASVDYEEYYEHKVAKNDTLYGIYRQYKEYKVHLNDIKTVNNITNPDKLKVGQVLILPVRK